MVHPIYCLQYMGWQWNSCTAVQLFHCHPIIRKYCPAHKELVGKGQESKAQQALFNRLPFDQKVTTQSTKVGSASGRVHLWGKSFNLVQCTTLVDVSSDTATRLNLFCWSLFCWTSGSVNDSHYQNTGRGICPLSLSLAGLLTYSPLGQAMLCYSSPKTIYDSRPSFP